LKEGIQFNKSGPRADSKTLAEGIKSHLGQEMVRSVQAFYKPPEDEVTIKKEK